MIGAPTPTFSPAWSGVTSVMLSVLAGLSVLKVLVTWLALPPAVLAVAVTVYRVFGVRLPLEVQCVRAASRTPRTEPAPCTVTPASVPSVTATVIGEAGRGDPGTPTGARVSFAGVALPVRAPLPPSPPPPA